MTIFRSGLLSYTRKGKEGLKIIILKEEKDGLSWALSEPKILGGV